MITVLCGGLGGARLALALKSAGWEAATTFVTNVADDCEMGDLLVCPDTDAVLYALGGVYDEKRGWGIRGDCFAPVPGAPAWFHLGDRDLEQHRRRTSLLRAGLSLTQVTAHLAERLGVRAGVLPASDSRLRTLIRCGGHLLSWQEWLVREHGLPRVDDVIYEGLRDATASVEVRSAIADADLLVFAPSSPVASLDPILALPGVRATIRDRRRPTVAVSPIARRLPIRCERDRGRALARRRLLAAHGVRHDPVDVARYYAPLLDAFILDEADAEDRSAIERLGINTAVAPTTSVRRGHRLIEALCRFLPRPVEAIRSAMQ